MSPPRILVIDDTLGRTTRTSVNPQRAAMCATLLVRDVSSDRVADPASNIRNPIAEAVFLRAQRPERAAVGDTVRNDLETLLEQIAAGWVAPSPERPRWAMVLLDLSFRTGRVTPASEAALGEGMPEGRDEDERAERYFGLEILNVLSSRFPDLPVVLFSSMPKDERVTETYNARGARGFLPKSGLDLSDQLRSMLWTHGLFPDPSERIVGYSKPLLLALREARGCCVHRRKVLLRGERGTGKELFASFIHHNGVNKPGGRLVAVNSSVLTDDLFASELFGHVRGAFTGATQDRQGLIAEAEGGTLFLDEVKDLSPRVQAGLLRVLQENQITRVGDTRSHSIDVRFITATEMDIEGLSEREEFRAALLDRVREGGTIRLPALRERRDDIPVLVETLLRRAEAAHPQAVRREVTREALDALASHDWPDNVRGLQACLTLAVSAFPDNDRLVPLHLRLPTIQGSTQSQALASPPELRGVETSRENTWQSLLQSLENVDWEEIAAPELAAAFRELQRVNARVVARLLRRAFKLNLRYDRYPEGELKFQPSIKLLTGNPELTTTEAKRLVARLLGASPEDIADLLEDPLLREAEAQVPKTGSKRRRSSKG